MLKSGLLIGLATLLFVFGAAMLSPLCTPCPALFAGLAAGYLAGVFDSPADLQVAIRRGAGSGAIAGSGGLIASLGAAAVNAIVLGPDGAARFAQQLGLPTGGPAQTGSFAADYYLSTLVLACGTAVFNLALMAGLGALGGLLWQRLSDRRPA